MRYIFFCLLFILSFGLSAAEDRKALIKDFKSAYAGYEKALTEGSKSEKYETAKRAFEVGEKLFKPDSANHANLAHNYGFAAYDFKPHGDEGAKMLKQALKSFETVYGKDSLETAQVKHDLARASVSSDKVAYGKRLFRQAIKVVENEQGPNSLLIARWNSEFGVDMLSRAQDRTSIGFFNRAQEIYEQNLPAHKADLAITNFWRGKYYLARKRSAQAEENFLSALETFEDIYPAASYTLSTHAFLIEIYEKRNEREKSTKHCQAIGKAKPIEADRDYLPVYRTQPTYPRDRLTANKEGMAIVELTVDENGFVKNPEILEIQGGRSFGTAALEAANQFRYAPRFENGKPVSTDGVRYKFTFDLEY